MDAAKSLRIHATLAMAYYYLSFASKTCLYFVFIPVCVF